jgi:hypothetical protein
MAHILLQKEEEANSIGSRKMQQSSDRPSPISREAISCIVQVTDHPGPREPLRQGGEYVPRHGFFSISTSLFFHK